MLTTPREQADFDRRSKDVASDWARSAPADDETRAVNVASKSSIHSTSLLHEGVATMKRQLAIAVLALTALNGVAFADTPTSAGQGDGMSAPVGRSDDRTSFVPVPGQESQPASSYGLTNDPARNYYFAP
jgi:hypothetical protein